MKTLKISEVIRGQDGQVKKVVATFGSGQWTFYLVNGRPEPITKIGRTWLPKKLYQELYSQISGIFFSQRRRATGGS